MTQPSAPHKPYNEKIYNVGNSIFPGFNDADGLMLCGYEFGESKHDEYLEKNHKEKIEKKASEINTFYAKSKIYDSPYDKNIIKWFRFFGHPLGEEDGYSHFDKCILQTNWSDGQGRTVNDYKKFEESSENFLGIVEAFRPKVLIFMGSKQIHYLNDPETKRRFVEIFGNEISPLHIADKPFDGRKFKVGFQIFDQISVISFPHPSGSRGLEDSYIKLFAPEMNEILNSYRKLKGF